MNIVKKLLCTTVVLPTLVLTAFAQLAVTVSPPKITGQKAIVKLAMKNEMTQQATTQNDRS